MFHTVDGLCYMKNDKYMKNCDYNHVFNVFLIFHVAGSIESMKHVFPFDEESNFASNECCCLKFE